MFGQRVAPGIMVFALGTGLGVPADATTILANYGTDRLRYTAPTWIDDTIYLDIEVHREVRPRREVGARLVPMGHPQPERRDRLREPAQDPHGQGARSVCRNLRASAPVLLTIDGRCRGAGAQPSRQAERDERRDGATSSPRRLDAVEAGGARALLVRGEGRAFCSGRDLADADPLHEDGEAILRDVFNPLIERMAGLAVPTIAAVHGACLGTGLGLALACDIVYAADDARIGSPVRAHRRGARQRRPRGVRLADRAASRARAHLHRAAALRDARRRSGASSTAASPVRDLVRRTRELAASIARGPTAAFLESKRIVRTIARHRRVVREVLAAEAAAQGRASRTHDYQDGISAFQEKRKPSFTGR